MSYLSQTDPEIANIIEKERLRQTNGLELIASENIVSRAVLEAMGSIMTNKYAEGYPGKRDYGGCEFHDMAENLARDRLEKALRRTACKRPAPLGHPGKHGGLFCVHETGREDPLHETQPGRPPFPRLPGQLHRQVLPGCPVRC